MGRLGWPRRIRKNKKGEMRVMVSAYEKSKEIDAAVGELIKELKEMPIRVVTKLCSTCDGKQVICVGMTDGLMPILRKCPACGGSGFLTVYYQSANLATVEECLPWVIPWRDL